MLGFVPFDAWAAHQSARVAGNQPVEHRVMHRGAQYGVDLPDVLSDSPCLRSFTTRPSMWVLRSLSNV
jgi:hypothetical protein